MTREYTITEAGIVRVSPACECREFRMERREYGIETETGYADSVEVQVCVECGRESE